MTPAALAVEKDRPGVERRRSGRPRRARRCSTIPCVCSCGSSSREAGWVKHAMASPASTWPSRPPRPRRARPPTSSRKAKVAAYRLSVRARERLAQLLVAERPGERDRLRRREGEVPSGRAVGERPVRAGDRRRALAARDEGEELARHDTPDESEVGCPSTAARRSRHHAPRSGRSTRPGDPNLVRAQHGRSSGRRRALRFPSARAVRGAAPRCRAGGRGRRRRRRRTRLVSSVQVGGRPVTVAALGAADPVPLDEAGRDTLAKRSCQVMGPFASDSSWSVGRESMRPTAPSAPRRWLRAPTSTSG